MSQTNFSFFFVPPPDSVLCCLHCCILLVVNMLKVTALKASKVWVKHSPAKAIILVNNDNTIQNTISWQSCANLLTAHGQTQWFLLQKNREMFRCYQIYTHITSYLSLWFLFTSGFFIPTPLMLQGNISQMSPYKWQKPISKQKCFLKKKDHTQSLRKQRSQGQSHNAIWSKPISFSLSCDKRSLLI